MQDQNKKTYVTKEEIHKILNDLNKTLAQIQLDIMLIKKQLEKLF